MTTNLQPNFAINDWPTQLAVFKAMYSTDDLHIKYLDDENEEVGISSQQDLEYAYQIALNSTNNVLRLIFRNSRNEIIAKQQLSVDLKTIKVMKSKQQEDQAKRTLNADFERSNLGFSKTQIEWLENYMENFKTSFSAEIEHKINASIQNALLDKNENTNDLISFDFKNTDLEKKVQNLFSLISESRLMGRALKTAYLEEELQSTGAFWAEFVKDFNLPDGSRCDPNVKFQKTWLIKNTGKLDWNSNEFQVKLVCVAGNINMVNDCESVNVENTKMGETASVSVELQSGSKSGNFFSEWVLCCNGFQFGPRIWCSISVNAGDELANGAQELLMKQELSLRMNLPQGLRRLSSIHGQNEFRNSIQSDDLDDEFVVVPDCFDLSKKWRPEEKFESNLDNNDLTIFDKSDLEEDKPNKDLILLNSTESSDTDSEIQVEHRETTKSLQVESIEEQTVIIAENKSIDTSDLLLNGKQNIEINEINNKTNIGQAQISSAFDMMKNAFSNLGSPSYVGSIDLVDKNNVNFCQDEDRLNNDSNMNKLVSMGFANRALNQRLLNKYKNNLEDVVQKLLEKLDNDWMESR